MVTYIYFVKCPNCEDEHFDFFDDAKAFAMSCMSQKPIITQTEVCRNDFGECTDSSDLGTVWSWEDECRETECENTEEPAKSVFTKDDFKQYADDPELKDDDDFFFNYGLVEDVAPTRFSFRNKEDFAEFTQLCREIGIIDGADLRKFMDETGANDGNLLDKLREYRAELGDDFEITEDFTDSGRFEYMGRHYDTVADFDTKALGFELGKTYSIIDSKDFAKANGAKIVPESVVCPADKTTSPENYFVRFSRNNKFELMDLQTFAIFMKNAEKQIVECSERKPIPEGMTIEELVEEMEENEDTVECTWCNDLFDKSECRYEVGAGGPDDGLGWLCSRCEAAIKSRGETLTFRENNYWDFLDEAVDDEPVENTSRTWMCYLNGNDLGTVEAKDESEAYCKMEKTWPEYNYNNEDVQVIPVDELEEELEWHTYKITFTTKANPDKEQTTTFKTWQSDVEYAWRMSNANIPHTTIKNIELIESLEENLSFSEMVTDSINHLTNDLGKDPMSDDFADLVIRDIEDNYDVEIPEDPEKYRDWASAVACEVSRQVNNTVVEAVEEPKQNKRFVLCPECEHESYDQKAGFCISCGN